MEAVGCAYKLGYVQRGRHEAGGVENSVNGHEGHVAWEMPRGGHSLGRRGVVWSWASQALRGQAERAKWGGATS